MQTVAQLDDGEDWPTALRQAGADMATCFEEFHALPHQDLRNWTVEGVSFRGAQLCKVVMTSAQRDVIARTNPERLEPIILDPRPRHEDDFEEARLRIAEARKGGLGALDLSFLKIDRLPDEVAELTALQKLNLSHSRQVSDLAPLAGLTLLRELDVDGAQVVDLTPLTKLTMLQSLNLESTRVANLAPLAGLTALRELNLSETEVADLTPLVALTAMQTLCLDATAVVDLAPLAHLSELLELHVSNTYVMDVTPLAGLTTLRMLSILFTDVKDVSVLAHLPDLIIDYEPA